jgi:hypothetical protein
MRGPTIYNLLPDANGVVKVERKLLGDRQHLHVYAEDLTSAVLHEAALPEAPTKLQDLPPGAKPRSTKGFYRTQRGDDPYQPGRR